MPRQSIYLDYAAATPVDPRVIEVMLPYLRDQFGNASAAHAYGRRAERALEEARATVASALNCQPNEIVFTSGGSESDNLALRGGLALGRVRGRHGLVTTRLEHPAVARTVEDLAARGECTPIYAPVDRTGLVDLGAYQAALHDETALASIIWGNNEIGTIQPIAALAAKARARGVLFHTDAVQVAGYLPIDVQAIGVDLLSLSAHKFYGPQGVGALFVRSGLKLHPAQTGGAQEAGRRAGTHNLAGIVGMAAALKLAQSDMKTAVGRLMALRDRLIAGIQSAVPGALLTGHQHQRLPNHASFIIEGVEANLLLMHLDMRGIMASSGSACKVGSPEPSEVLLALSYLPEQALCSLRLTLGYATNETEIDQVVAALHDIVPRLRAMESQAKVIS